MLFARQNPLDDARNTLSSWDNCMAKAYCKWPVIVAIIVGSLILISVITCIARCICCGAECACCCFRCCTCCCSGSGRGHKRMKSEPTPAYPQSYSGAPPFNPYAQAHAAAPPPPVDTRPVNQQYRSNPMPSFGAAPAAQPERPQFATFDSTKAVVNEDALPAMPTWKDGRDVHVEVEEQPIPEKRGDVELDRLNHNGSATNASMVGMAAISGARRSPGPGRSPISPTGNQYGMGPGYQNSASPHRNSPGPYELPQEDYRRASPGPNASFSPAGGYAQDQAHGRRSPGQNQVYEMYDERNQFPQEPSHQQHFQYSQYDQHDQRDYYDEVDRHRSPAPMPNPNNYQGNHSLTSYNHPYDGPAPPPMQSHQQDRHSPAPQYNDPYDGPAPPPGAQRSFSPMSGTTRYEPPSASPAPSYPGQQTYNAGGAGYPGQQAYQAFQPSTGVTRKPVEGSYREL